MEHPQIVVLPDFDPALSGAVAERDILSKSDSIRCEEPPASALFDRLDLRELRLVLYDCFENASMNPHPPGSSPENFAYPCELALAEPIIETVLGLAPAPSGALNLFTDLAVKV